MIAILIFASCFGIVYLLMGRLMGVSLTVAERLATYTEPVRAAPLMPGRWSDLPTADRVMNRLNISRSLEQLLEQADLPFKPFEFVLLIAVSVLGLSVVGLFIRLNTVVVGAMGLLGFLAPLGWVRLRRQRRRDAFTRQLPDALQAIGNTLRAGYGFGHGMAVVATDLPAPISVEFARAQREMNLGLTVDDVLENMARRIQSPDFDLAVSGILVNRRVGGNLAELLDHISATMRERVRLKNFIRVLTSQQRLSALIVIAVPVVLMIVLLLAWREYTSYLFITPVGRVMLALAVLMQLLGTYAIRRIVAIDV